MKYISSAKRCPFSKGSPPCNSVLWIACCFSAHWLHISVFLTLFFSSDCTLDSKGLWRCPIRNPGQSFVSRLRSPANSPACVLTSDSCFGSQPHINISIAKYRSGRGTFKHRPLARETWRPLPDFSTLNRVFILQDQMLRLPRNLRWRDRQKPEHTPD